ncbi:MAG: hypothetical protein ACYDDV_02570 [Methanoregula sp.]
MDQKFTYTGDVLTEIMEGERGNTNQNITYEGDVLTDITSFSMIQNIFDGQKVINDLHVKTLDSIIQLLIFYENIWTVEPFIYGGKIEINSQTELNKLIQENIVKQITQENSDNEEAFRSHYKEVLEKIKPHRTLEEFHCAHGELISDLQQYEKNFSLTNHQKALELAKSIKLDKKYIPLAANLLRTNFYINTVKQIEKKENKIVTYSPNVLRTPLVENIVKNQNERNKKRIDEIIKEHIDLIETSEKGRRELLTKKGNDDFKFELPLLTGIIVDKCTKKEDFFDNVLAWRKDRDAERMRNLLIQLQIDMRANKPDIYDQYNDQIKNLTTAMGAKSNLKADLVGCLSNPTSVIPAVGGVATAIATQNPLPAWGAAPLVLDAYIKTAKTLWKPLIDYLMNRDLYLLIKMRETAKKPSYEKDKFERLFGVTIQQ